MKNKVAGRIRFLSVAIFLVAAFFSTKLFFLQIVKGDEYAELADRQYLKSAKTFLNRGSIYFSRRDGVLVPAATLKQQFILSLNPKLIQNSENVYELLSSQIDINKEFFQHHVERDSAYEKIADNLDQQTADQIRSLNLRGVDIAKEKKRIYPAGSLASHVVGLMSYHNNDFVGTYGLEKHYNDVLTHKQTGSFASFFAEIFLNLADEVKSSESKSPKEGDLILTIEPIVQGVLEKELESLVNKYQAEGAGAILMDPNTGDILAMAAWPDFIPGEKITDIEVLTNPLVERVFEIGSVIKPLTLAAGLDMKVITPETTYNDLGQVTIDNYQISNFDKKGRGVVDMQRVLNDSLNTGAIFVMRQMGRDSFRKYMLSFGLGQKTGIDLPGEVGGLISNLDSQREVEYATASFGQGLAITPVGAIRAFAILANGGKLVTPRVVKSIRYKDGSEKVFEPEIKEVVISRRATDDITAMMIKAVDEALLGGTLKLNDYSVAGKTGTAQIAKTDGRGYRDDAFLHAFFGFYPAYEPKIIGYFYLINPQGVDYASETIPPSFMNVAKFLLNYYQIPPDR